MRYSLAVIIALFVLPILSFVNTPNLFHYFTTKKEPKNRAWETFMGAIKLINDLIHGRVV